MNKMRKIISMITMVMVLVMPVSVQAMTPVVGEVVTEDIPGITPRNTNIHLTNISLSFNGSNANCSSSVLAYSNTSKVSIQMTLYKYSSGAWVRVTSWSNSANGTYVSLSKSKSVSSGRYKLTCVYTANSEVITKSTEKTK